MKKPPKLDPSQYVPGTRVALREDGWWHVGTIIQITPRRDGRLWTLVDDAEHTRYSRDITHLYQYTDDIAVWASYPIPPKPSAPPPPISLTALSPVALIKHWIDEQMITVKADTPEWCANVRPAVRVLWNTLPLSRVMTLEDAITQYVRKYEGWPGTHNLERRFTDWLDITPAQQTAIFQAAEANQGKADIYLEDARKAQHQAWAELPRFPEGSVQAGRFINTGDTAEDDYDEESLP